MQFLARMPLLVAFTGIAALAMLVPAAMAMATEDFETGRTFLYSALFFLVLTLLMGFATQGVRPVLAHTSSVADRGLCLPARGAGGAAE